MDMQLGRKLAAEFIGTFCLIFIGAGSIIVGSTIVGIALAHGLAIALMVTALGHISGGLFNPALTVGLWVTRRLGTYDAIAYIIVQLLGGIAGAAVLLLYPEALRDVSDGVPAIAGINFAEGVAIEAVLTVFLMLAVFGNAIDRRGHGREGRGPAIGGFGIGLIITMDVLAGGRLTGAAMNPARAFGPALINGTWDDHLVYWIGPVIGAVIAAVVYHYVFLDPEQRAEATAA